jgi:hypothetical protein
MSCGAHRGTTPTRHGTEWAHKSSPAHEASRIAHMVRVGSLTIDQARRLIAVNNGEAAVLRKILASDTADSALLFRRSVLRLFNAIVQMSNGGNQWKRKSAR